MADGVRFVTRWFLLGMLGLVAGWAAYALSVPYSYDGNELPEDISLVALAWSFAAGVALAVAPSDRRISGPLARVAAVLVSVAALCFTIGVLDDSWFVSGWWVAAAGIGYVALAALLLGLLAAYAAPRGIPAWLWRPAALTALLPPAATAAVMFSDTDMNVDRLIAGTVLLQSTAVVAVLIVGLTAPRATVCTATMAG